jgi:type I restriction enzyme R subunit
MKQAVQEGFIMDVLAHYTPVETYYRLMKTIEDDPEFDTRRARKKLRRYVDAGVKHYEMKFVYHTVDHLIEHRIKVHHRPSTCASAASAWGSQKVMSIA